MAKERTTKRKGCILSHFRSYVEKKEHLSKYAKYVKDKASGRMVLHVTSLEMLIQAIGDVKYNICRTIERGKTVENNWRIFFRGETKLQHVGKPYLPTLYRSNNGISPVKSRADEKIARQIKEIQKHCKPHLGKLDKGIVEGALQHYGLKSRWLDAVDNVWNALWFACHDTWRSGADNEYVHYVRRNPLTEISTHQYCYIVLLGVDTSGMKSKGIPGYLENESSAILDLRYALPSFFIRPHAQHGILVRLMGKDHLPAFDMGNLIRGIIRINLAQALEWLGEGTLLSSQTLFPPPSLDIGFGDLLKAEEKIATACITKTEDVIPVKLQRIC